MKTAILLIVTSALLIACSTDEPDDLYLVEHLYGEYTLSVLVATTMEDADPSDEGFIVVARTKVFSYPYVTGTLSLNEGFMSYHANVEVSDISIDFEANISIVPRFGRNPGEFHMHATYETELGEGAFARGITWDGSILNMYHTQAGDPAQYRLYWHKE